jgi:predicted nucleic acid-binding protein
VALRWLLGSEPEAATAEALLRTTAEARLPVLVSPTFHAAVTAALHERSPALGATDAQQALSTVAQYPFQVVQAAGLYLTALKLAQGYQIPAFDHALSLAVAGLAGCELWTADNALLTAAGRLAHVRSIAGYGEG